MSRPIILALTAVLLLACGMGGGDEAAHGGESTGTGAGTHKAPALTEGHIRATIGGQEKSFSRFEADSNIVTATKVTIAGTTDDGEELRIVASGITLPADGRFPLTVETEPAEEYTTQKRLVMTYTTADGIRYLAAADAKVIVNSFTDGKVVAAIPATMLAGYQRDPIELGGATVEVVLTTPATARAGETPLTGQ